MKQKVDLRIIKSKTMIKKAFLRLMQEKGYNNITITSIAEKAMINRKTFYFHYETKQALYEEIIQETFSVFDLDIFFKNVISRSDLNQASKKLFISKILETIKQQKQTFKILFAETENNLFIHQLKTALSEIIYCKVHKSGSDMILNIPLELLISSYVATLIEILKWWIEQTHISSEEALTIIFSILESDFLKLMGFDN